MANTKQSTTRIVISGLIMGMAEVVPGVSGGTVAFVAGIYERLLGSIASFRKAPSLVLSRNWKALWTELDVMFLIKLGLGMVAGIAIGVAGITYMLDEYPPLIWALFFGLVLASIPYIAIKMSWQRPITWFIFMTGCAVAMYLGNLPTGSGSESLLFVFICGMIAIVALILPGISGSFMLLMLGMYTYIVRDTVKGLVVEFSGDKLLTLSVFALGCVIGLLSIARLLKWAFENYRDQTIALLVGFMAGALMKIWPWRNAVAWLDKESGRVTYELPEGEYKVLQEVGVWPMGYSGEPHTMGAILCLFAGIVLIYVLYKVEKDR